MTIETELKTLVSLYSSYDAEKVSYLSNLDKEALLRLDADFIKLINKLLLKDGPDKIKIRKNYKRLTVCFHPDRKENFSPEIKWIEQNLSEARNDGACFKTLSVCYQKLFSPEEFKSIKFEDIDSQEDLKRWLETLKINARTFTERSFYTSLLDLLHESTDYFDKVGKIKPKGIRALVSFLPMIFISFGTFVFAEELFVVYALYFALLKSGQYFSRSGSKDLQELGYTLQTFSVVTATTTSTLLVRLVEMTFWASRQCYDLSLQIGSSILSPLIPGTSNKKFKNKESDENSICMDLILANKNISTSDNFQTAQLKMIAAPVESYLGLLNQQFFKNWRAGGDKSRALESFLLKMRVIDKDDELPVEEKIEKAYSALDLIKKNPVVYSQGGSTALAVDRAERVIILLKTNTPEKQTLAITGSLEK
ncbi:MAG: J domain-containing protein [Legionella longbeachae]|nr:J domain-containing protein [Legionella longbeachae]